MGNMEYSFVEPFQEMTWNGPIIFMHWKIDEENKVVDQITPNVERIFGYTPEDIITGNVPILSIIFEEDRDKFRAAMVQRIASQSPWESSYRIYAKNGDIRFIKSYTYLKQDNITSKISNFSFLFDQTEIKQEINMHISLEHQWATAIDSAREGVWDWDLEKNDVFFSKHWKSMLGYEEHELPNQLIEWRKRIHPLDVEKVNEVIEEHIRNDSVFFESEHRLRHSDGTYRWILDRGKAVKRDEYGVALRMIGTHVDITERKETEYQLQQRNKELEHLVDQVKELSITDPLTSLYNRRKMIDEIKKAQHQLEKNRQPFTIAILDLDYFKNINDQYGHTFGDIALQTFSNLLKRQIPSPNIVARWGGEEFMLLFHNKNGIETQRQLLSLQACCNDELLKYRMDSVKLSFSAGICEVTEHQSREVIIKNADQAMYLAKSLGRNQINLYKEGLPVV
ncbi:diguanylate cyclase [Paenisporosarcina antarctica]|uniref:Diguanylate cyclase n=2 Tax=Paenisporosarcina antarctica TaxID=417367 RepID=A0A4P6ZXL0_9BACL|nr:diguanylate cyclase [Paenisporosarcina antarctica]